MGLLLGVGPEPTRSAEPSDGKPGVCNGPPRVVGQGVERPNKGKGQYQVFFFHAVFLTPMESAAVVHPYVQEPILLRT